MSIGINTNYSNYTNYYSSTSKTQSSSEKSNIEASKKTEDDMLNYYKEKYSDLNFSVGYNTKGTRSGNSGTGNVVMHPGLLKKMVADPEFAAKVENNIKDIPQAEELRKNLCARDGMKVISSGWLIGKDGDISGSWSHLGTADGSSKIEDEKTELLEKLLKKRKEKIVALEDLTEQRTEGKKEFNNYVSSLLFTNKNNPQTLYSAFNEGTINETI